jgi:hypothetical protein
MKSARIARAAALLTPVLVLGALAGCGHSPGTATSPSPPAPASSQPAAVSPAAPSPRASSPAALPAWTVVSSRLTYPWHWPDATHPAKVQHVYPVPPVPQLIAISAGQHPEMPGQRSYNRMAFTFTTAFPSYHVRFVSQLVGDSSGRPIALAGNGVLEVTFRGAQAHTAGGGSSVAAAPPANFNYSRMVSWAPAGDSEGVLSYGIGITWPIPHSNPQFAVRTFEVEKVNAQGQRVYVVAIDVDSTPLG